MTYIHKYHYRNIITAMVMNMKMMVMAITNDHVVSYRPAQGDNKALLRFP